MVSEPMVQSTTLPDSTTAPPASTMVSTPSPCPSANTTIHITNQPLLLLSNMFWKHQISMVLETYSMMELLNGTQTCPD